MFSFYSTLVLALAISTAFAAPVDDNVSSPPSSWLSGKGGSSGNDVGSSNVAKVPSYVDEGTVDGFYHYFYNDGHVNASFSNGPGSLFNVTWKGNGDILAGKGWETGDSNRVIKYTGNLDIQRRGTLKLVGSTQDTNISYFVVEILHERPGFGEHIGSVECDGFSYDITLFKDHWDGQDHYKYESTRSNATFSGGQVDGTITLGCHWKAWVALGMQAEDGGLGPQMMMVEGDGGSKHRHAKGTSGSASITFSEGSSS